MDGDMLTLKVACRNCGEEHKLRVRAEDYYAWESGEKLVQEAFPYLPAEKRELLLSGICPTCWDNMFGRFED